MDVFPGKRGSIEDAAWLCKRANDPGDIFVLDGYSFGEDYQKQIKAMGLPLVCIDDLYPLSSYS